MKRRLYILFIILFACSNHLQAKNSFPSTVTKLYFIENKGQIKDQFGNARKDIQYVLHGQGLTVFIGDGQLHYQFTHKTFCSPGDGNGSSQIGKSNRLFQNPRNSKMESPDIETYRMDVELSGANKNAVVITEDEQAYYENYYLPGCAVNGIEAHTYKKITYRNILPDIDWVIYIKGEKLEHEFVIRPGGNVSNIRLKYNGQTGLEINDDGSLTATTPMGIIKEQAPVCYLSDNHTSCVSYKLHGNVLSYKTSGYEQALTIDPALEWGTYYGPDSSSSMFYDLACDGNANIYAAGFTYAGSDIATVGGYQVAMGGFGNGAAYLVKFDSSGNRLWATYYGGSNGGCGFAVACDHAGNVYMGGNTTSFDSIATPGSHQPAMGGAASLDPVNGFLVKFSPSGSRIWATYYGGDQQDIIFSVNCDNFSNVYIAGAASSTFNIATPGSFEPVFNNPGGQLVAGFLAKFDSTGVRLWGTYYIGYRGDTITDVTGVRSCTDGNNVYFSAATAATDSITTPGCWQPLNAGSTDCFIAKFNNLGNRIWATYYGGGNQELNGSAACIDGSLYLLGQTESDTGIASPGCYQPLRGGGFDAFLAKFNTATGMREWGTYYGGPADENAEHSNISANGISNIYITGCTLSTTGIASPGAWQQANGGGTDDAFLAEFNTSGARLWSTYYGGSGDDEAHACAFDGLNVYICGVTSSINNIATAGSFESTYDGDPQYDVAFLAKFADLLPAPILGSGHICLGYTDTLSDSVTGGTWSSSNTAMATVGQASGIVTGVSAGVVTITYFAPAGGDYVTISDTVKICPEEVLTVFNSNNKATVFPNPATTQLTITATDKITTIVICNLLGQTVYTQEYNTGQVQVDIADLPPGIYFVKVDNTKVQQFVKE